MRSEQRVPLGLHRLDLFEQQFEPIEFTADLDLKMLGQRTPIPRPQFVQSSLPIAMQRLVSGYALAEQQTFDAIDVLDPLGDQNLALAAKPTAVLFLRCRRFDHGAHPGFAALVGQQRTKQRLAVNPIRLRLPALARGCDRGGIDDVAFNPFILQDTMNPEAVQPRFLNDDDREQFPSPRKSLLLESRKPRQQRTNIPGSHIMLRHFLAAARRQRGDQPA